jgi:hypothetical protein
MQLISRDELKEKLESGQPFKLVMTLHESAYRQAHIANSINSSARRKEKQSSVNKVSLTTGC